MTETDAARRQTGWDIMTQDPRLPEPNYRTLLEKIFREFTGVYLTLLSIIQGVAFTDLSVVIIPAYHQLTPANWIQVITNLAIIIVVWNHFMGDALIWEWIPDLGDALLLFGTGVFELAANHTALVDLTAWLAVLALMMFGWSFAVFYIRRQEEGYVRDPVLLRLMRQRALPTLLSTLVSAIVLALVAVLTRLLVLSAQATQGWKMAAAIVAALMAFVAVGAIGLISVRFWRVVATYARTGALPADMAER